MQKQTVGAAVKTLLGGEPQLEFASDPGLIGGIELAVNGHKIAWSIEGYLAALSDSVEALLKATIETAPTNQETSSHAQ